MCKVSIVIPTYNNAVFLQDTLSSIQNQDYNDYEIIVVDDGSTDNTKEILGRYGDEIKYVYQENSGACSKPRNVGIGIAKGEYIAIFDSDDIMKPDKLSLQVSFLDSNPNAHLVFTNFSDFKGDRIYPNHVDTCTVFRFLPKDKVGRSEYVIDKTAAYETLLQENYIGASSIMFRKSLCEQIGYFDENLDSSEDIDFTLRAAQICNFGYIDKICHLRRLHGNSMSSKTEKVIKRQITLYSKHLTIAESIRRNKQLVSKISDLYISLGYFYRINMKFHAALKSYLQSIKIKKFPNRSYLDIIKLLCFILISRTYKK